jgi:hypothetical protein
MGKMVKAVLLALAVSLAGDGGMRREFDVVPTPVTAGISEEV